VVASPLAHPETPSLESSDTQTHNRPQWRRPWLPAPDRQKSLGGLALAPAVVASPLAHPKTTSLESSDTQIHNRPQWRQARRPARDRRKSRDWLAFALAVVALLLAAAVAVLLVAALTTRALYAVSNLHKSDQIKAEAAPKTDDPRGNPAAGRADSESERADDDPQAMDGKSWSVTLAFAGDVHFEGRVATLLDSRDATLGPMSSALRSADVAVVNLESALTSGGSPAPKELEAPSLRHWFRSPPAALALLERSGVDAVSLANNHGADYGAAGLRESLRAARNSPVAVIGIGRDADQAFRPYQTSVDGVEVAVLAADASPLESNASIWDVGPGGPGLATARDNSRLLAAVRAANARSDVVAVYLHWGTENQGCPTSEQRQLARSLADAGADVVVGSHAHIPLGAGMLDDTYVSYGLGNFLWYHGKLPNTGVLRIQIVDGEVVRDDWVPGEIRPTGGPPRPVTGSARRAAIREWRGLRSCTDLAPGPGEKASVDPASSETNTGGDTLSPGGGGDIRMPTYAATIDSVPSAVWRRMTGRSHDQVRCPVGSTDLRLLTMHYVGFDGRAHTGQMVVHHQHARGLVGVFRELYEARFPIHRMQLAYGGDDNRSMAADNTSAYNCRMVVGESTFSDHAYGGAVDINPIENPYVTTDGVLPARGRRFADVDRSRDADAPRGVIVADDVVVRAFARIGWKWGGVWNEADYQHFHAP
jgi:Bacterial capsule synthesis protein PGA_cap/D-alanyl-D-alanine carboxypeptidase